MTNETNKRMVELCDKVLHVLKLNDWDKWMVTEPLQELRSLIEGEGKEEVKIELLKCAEGSVKDD